MFLLRGQETSRTAVHSGGYHQYSVYLRGTFVGLEDIIAKRVGKKSFGFGSSGSKSDMTKAELLMQVTADDLIDFGMIPEFVGRLPILAPLEPLTEDAMVDILTQPRNALVKQYRKLFDMEGAEIEFEDAALRGDRPEGPCPPNRGPRSAIDRGRHHVGFAV